VPALVYCVLSHATLTLLRCTSPSTPPTPLLPLFFFHDPATTEIYTLSLHDALPISPRLMPNSGRMAVTLGDSGRDAGMPASPRRDRKSTRLNSSHVKISYAVFCLKKKKKK